MWELQCALIACGQDWPQQKAKIRGKGKCFSTTLDLQPTWAKWPSVSGDGAEIDSRQSVCEDEGNHFLSSNRKLDTHHNDTGKNSRICHLASETHRPLGVLANSPFFLEQWYKALIWAIFDVLQTSLKSQANDSLRWQRSLLVKLANIVLLWMSVAHSCFELCAGRYNHSIFLATMIDHYRVHLQFPVGKVPLSEAGIQQQRSIDFTFCVVPL